MIDVDLTSPVLAGALSLALTVSAQSPTSRVTRDGTAQQPPDAYSEEASAADRMAMPGSQGRPRQTDGPGPASADDGEAHGHDAVDDGPNGGAGCQALIERGLAKRVRVVRFAYP